jgi:hypothetical protein
MNPADDTVAALVAALDDNLRELWEERAAVREHDGNQPRELAEAMALLDVVRMKTPEAFACWMPGQERKS